MTGYINPSLTHTEVSSTTTTSATSRDGTTAQSTGKSKSTTATSKQIPSTPPPSYEHVLEEVRNEFFSVCVPENGPKDQHLDRFPLNHCSKPL